MKTLTNGINKPRRTRVRLMGIAVLIGCVVALIATQAKVTAATPQKMFGVETWTGGDNNDGKMTSNGNWAGVGGAGANDDLIFPQVDAFHWRSVVNDFPVNTNFDSLTFTGGEYVVTGNQMFLTNGMTVDTPNGVGDAPWIRTNIVIAANQTWSFLSFITSMDGVLNLNNHTLTCDTAEAGGGLSIAALINGTGSIIKTGPGTLFIEDDGDGFGTTTINAGAVQVDGDLGNVALAGGTLRGTGDVGAISGNGTINPGTGGTGSTSILTAHGNVTLGAGTTFFVDLNGTTVGTEYDRLTVPGGNITLNGATLAGRLDTTVPTIGQQFIILQATNGHTLSGQFAQGNSIAIQGRLFSITYNSTNVTLTSVRTTRTWDGDQGNFWSFANNWDGNFLPKVNLDDDLVFPAGASQIINHYDFPNGSSFHNLTFTGNGYDIDGGTGITLTGGITENTPAGDTGVKIGFDITLGQSQTFMSNGFGVVANPNGLRFTTTEINLNNFNLTITGTGRQLYQGPITGTGNLIKNGTGGATFQGVSTFTGGTQVNNGALIVSGTLPGTITLNGGTVGGSGTVGPITGSGTIAPGALPASANPITAVLNVNGNVNLGPGSAMALEIGGASPGSEFDKLNVTGSVALGTGTTSLNGVFLNSFNPTPGQQFTIIQASNGVSGTFAQGNSIVIGTTIFSITYNANSVVLKAVATTAAGVTVKGRVVTEDGRGITNAKVILSNGQGFSRTVVTKRNGAFSFDEVATGEMYIITVESQRFTFDSQVLQVFDPLSTLQIIGRVR